MHDAKKFIVLDGELFGDKTMGIATPLVVTAPVFFFFLLLWASLEPGSILWKARNRAVRGIRPHFLLHQSCSPLDLDSTEREEHCQSRREKGERKKDEENVPCSIPKCWVPPNTLQGPFFHPILLHQQITFLWMLAGERLRSGTFIMEKVPERNIWGAASCSKIYLTALCKY